MQRCLATAVFVVASSLAPLLFAQSKAKAENVPEIPYDSVPNFLKLPPNLYLGEGIGVATNSKGHVFVYTRSGDTRLFEFDQNGTFVREIGQGLYGFEFAHAVRVDRDDNIWAVDEGTNMVIKFNPEGRVVMVIGRRPEAVDGLAAAAPGTPPPAAGAVRLQPADRRRLGRGRQHLRHRRLRQLARREVRQERPLRQAGRHARQSAPGQLNLPHTMATDAQGNVYVGDRSNARVQVFDNDLNFKAIYDNVGNPWAVCISPGPHQYLFVSNSIPDNGLSQFRDITGEIYKMELDGTIIGKFGKAGQAAEGVQHGARDRLPQSERAVRGGDHRVARAEDHPAAAGIDCDRTVGGRHETPDAADRRGGRMRRRRPPVRLRPRPRDPFDAASNLAEDAGRHPSRRGRRRGHQFEGPHLRLHAHRQSDRGARQLARLHARRLAALRVRSEPATSSARSARASTGSSSRTPSRVDRAGQHLGRGRGARTRSSSSIPTGAW